MFAKHEFLLSKIITNSRFEYSDFNITFLGACLKVASALDILR